MAPHTMGARPVESLGQQWQLLAALFPSRYFWNPLMTGALLFPAAPPGAGPRSAPSFTVRRPRRPAQARAPHHLI